MKWISIGDFRFGIEEKKYIQQVVDSNRITESKKVMKFENNFSKYLETKYTILTNSGTSALILGLESLKQQGVKVNTKIITSPLTFAATVNAIALTGFNPIFVDIDPDTFVINPELVSEHLENTRQINDYSMVLPVHLMGYPADMEKLNNICKKNNLIAFEDSAQAHGTVSNGRKCGALSKVSAFSFYIAHNIQVGEMGAITTSDVELAKLARRIKANGRLCDCQICTRSQGICPYNSIDNVDPRFTHSHIGYNFKTTEFMAAIGLAQLSRIDSIIKKRQENVKVLNDGLAKYSDIIQLPKFSKDISYMAYPLVLLNDSKISRNKLLSRLEKKGIESRPLFSCIPTHQPSYNHLKRKYSGRLPNAEFVGKNGFYIGCHQYLSEDDLDYIIQFFKKLF
ncbi:hypothetical protein CL673_05195 [Candidatus Bathyarchaeota archaeon]|nr:hypothetical protein [Candidatus Bathyarchaeota archaeon]